MKLATQTHTIRLQAPFYSDDDRTMLHRYFDSEFIPRFQQDVQRHQFHLPQFSSWLIEESKSPHDQKPVLRLPLHRAFHVVCCEVACEQLGRPALDPKRIMSAGFVIRRIGGNQERAWMLEDGEPLGWHVAPTELRDPDVYRRLCANGVLHARADEPTYSGEQVHPLHVLTSTDQKGKRHTLLHGFLPLGGSYFERDPLAVIDSDSQQDTEQAAAKMLPWPFGYRQPLTQTWQATDTRPIDHGRPNQATYELLRVLVNRYHLGEAEIPENDRLEQFFQQLWFYDEPLFSFHLRRQTFRESNILEFTPYRQLNVWSYMQACFAKEGENPLVRWMIQQEKLIEERGESGPFPLLAPLPNSSGKGTLGYSLFMLPADAQEIRALLGQRLREQTLIQVREIPLPKFNQDKNDIYQIVPFIRATTDNGKEHIHWADTSARSIVFRVAAPFDPEASRPALIPMPSLADLKRGLAKGASFITPADTFNLLNSLNLKKGASPDAVPEDPPGPGLGIQWICSLSLPVITLVAMILLMIMISLLNIVFFWLPWVRICLPFPKIDK